MQHGGHITKDLLGPRGVPVGGGGVPFSPLDVDGLGLWLDANDSTTLFQDAAGTTPAVSDADPVGLWQDKSGNARHVTQATAGNRPALKLNIQNGLPVIRTDGDDLLSGTYALSGAATLFVVAKFANTTTSIQALFRSGKYGLAITTFNNMGFVDAGKATITKYAFTNTAHNIHAGLVEVVSGNNVNVTQYLNGEAKTPQNWNIASTSTAIDLFGATGPANLMVANGEIAEALVYAATLSLANRLAIHTYLSDKWGITLP